MSQGTPYKTEDGRLIGYVTREVIGVPGHLRLYAASVWMDPDWRFEEGFVQTRKEFPTEAAAITWLHERYKELARIQVIRVLSR